MTLESSIIQVKREIKSWEHNFQKQNNKPPNKSDVKENLKVLKLYKTYKVLKLKQQQQQQTKQPQHANPLTPVVPKDSFIDAIKDISDDNESFDDNIGGSEDQIINQNSNLGPTPQAGGKVLSIFDMKLTPPESSPLKIKSELPSEPLADPMIPDAEFKTPTKPKPIIQNTPTRSNNNGSSFMQRIANIASLKSPVKTPSKHPNNQITYLLETPNYLNRNILKFDFTQSHKSKQSPFVTNENNAQISHSLTTESPSTPSTKPTIDFQVSPSPLKSQGFLNIGGGNKRLLDVFHDHKKIHLTDEEINQYDFHNGEHDDDDDEHGDDNTGRLPSRKRSKTQKRTTRRWKMKPVAATQEDDLRNKDLHKVMEQINHEKESTMEKMLQGDNNDDNNDGEGDDDDDDDDDDDNNTNNTPVNSKTSTSTGKKIAPISHNYKRLKIHKKGKGKFRRRR